MNILGSIITGWVGGFVLSPPPSVYYVHLSLYFIFGFPRLCRDMLLFVCILVAVTRTGTVQCSSSTSSRSSSNGSSRMDGRRVREQTCQSKITYIFSREVEESTCVWRVFFVVQVLDVWDFRDRQHGRMLFGVRADGCKVKSVCSRQAEGRHGWDLNTVVVVFVISVLRSVDRCLY